MRAELNNLENIDLYLSGKMGAAQKGAFEAQMAADPALKSIVEDQQLLIQTVNRKALMAEINTVAGLTTVGAGTAWGLSKIIWTITGSIIGVGAIATGIYFVANPGDDAGNDIVANDIALEEAAENINYPEPTILYASDEDFESLANGQDEDAMVTLDESENDITSESSGSESSNQSESNGSSHSNTDNDESSNHASSGNSRDTETDGTSGASTNLTSKPNNSNITSKSTKSSKKNSSTNSKTDTGMDLKTFSNANLNARYPGGDVKRNKFVGKNIRFPRTPKDKDLEGVVRVDFFVDESGWISEIYSDMILMKRNDEGTPFSNGKMIANRGSVKLFEKEAARIVRIMEFWEPATDRFGNPIPSTAKLYFKFDIDEGCYVYQMN